jgi:aspartate aminotransferase
MQFARRMLRLGTETAFEVLAKARALEAQGREVVHLEIGEPDFDTPQHIVEAAIAALRRGETHYTPSAGIMPLRRAIAEEVSRTRDIPVEAEQVVVVPGAKPIIFFTVLATCQRGDEVIYPNPGFPIYESMIKFAGAKPVPIRLRMEHGFRLDPDELRELMTPRTRLIILNSPSNPTGSVMSRADVEAVARVLQAYDCWVLSDEIYSRILYDGAHYSIASIPGFQERTIILDGFSKSYAMTGWRLGYGVMPREMAQHITRLMTNSNSCTATFSQYAGIAALTGTQEPVKRMVEAFRERRQVIIDGLNALPGVKCLSPQGAFYAFPNITGTGLSSRALADLLLRDAGVAVLSGTSFGIYGEGFLRLSYANSVANLRKAIERMGETLAKVVR